MAWKKEKKKREKAAEGGAVRTHYPLWDNYREALGCLVAEIGGKSLWVMGGDILLAVLCPFAAMALPSAVVYLLGSGWEPGMIFLALAGYVMALQALNLLQGYLNATYYKWRFVTRIGMGVQLFKTILGMDFETFESRKGQEKIEGGKGNIYRGNDEGIEAFLGAVSGGAAACLGLAVYSIVIGLLNPWALLLLLLASGAVMGVHFYADKRSVRYEDAYIKNNQSYNYLKREVMAPAGGKDIRLYRMWNWFQREFETMKEEFARIAAKQSKCGNSAHIVESLLSFARDLLMYVWLIDQMAQGRIDLAAFLLYVGIAGGFNGWMSSLIQNLKGILYQNRHMDRYRDCMKLGQEEEGGGQAVSSPGRSHEIRLEHVSFRYEGNEEDTIHDLSLTIRPGEKIALVGMNGAGKSTLVKLVCGLYQPSRGKIYLDGQDVSMLSRREYRREFAVVFQEVFAFSFPLGENVTCRREEDINRERLKECLQKADLWERVQEMEKQEHTYLNKDVDASGINLSGGELQKLMLARALYKDSPVVILDEPTAALDPIAESSMYDKYYEMTREKTSIFISHRLSSTKFCDRILYMDNGRITEEGNHVQLMEKQGAYAYMFHTQAQYYQEDEKKEKGEN